MNFLLVKKNNSKGDFVSPTSYTNLKFNKMKQKVILDENYSDAHCLKWTALDVHNKVENWVNMYGDIGEDYKIIDEHTEEHRDYLFGILQDAIEENSDWICEKINDALWNYMIDNKTEIISDLIDNKYLNKIK